MNRKHIHIVTLLLCLLPTLAQGQKPQLIATRFESYYSGKLTSIDSNSLIYKPANRNACDGNNLPVPQDKSDTLFNFKNIKTRNEMELLRRIYNTYNAAGLLDTQRIISDTPVHPVINTYEYNAANDLTAQTHIENWFGKWEKISRILNTYSGSNITEVMEQSWNGATLIWQEKSRKRFVYTNGNLTSDTVGSYTPYRIYIKSTERATRYTYNARNNNDTVSLYVWRAIGAFALQIKNVMVYDANNNVIQRDNYLFDTATGDVTSTGKTTYKFDAANRVTIDSAFTFDVSTQQFISTAVTLYHYNAAGLCDTQYKCAIEVLGGPLVNSSRSVYTYNTWGQRTGLLFMRWDPVSSTWGAGASTYTNYAFYYTPFATGISNVVENNDNISLYPNPANDFITLKLDNKQPSTIAIYNTTGALLRQWEEKAGSTTRMIPLHGFENGNYILTVRGADGCKVSRQFVVAR